jgi:TolB protein
MAPIPIANEARVEGDSAMATTILRRFVARSLVGAAALAGLPSRGDEFVLASTRSGNSEVVLYDSETKKMTNLTNSSAHDCDPVPSPDGKTIAFASNRDGRFHLYLMDADGKHLRQVTNGLTDDLNPSWSPDGTRIVCHRRVSYAGQAPPPDLHIIDAKALGSKRIVSDAWDPAWSPDGRSVAFTSGRGDGRFRVYIAGIDGSGTLKVNEDGNPRGNTHPAYSPDGTRLAFTGIVDPGKTDAPLELFLCGPDGQDRKQLTSLGGLSTFASWSPDGTRLAFQKRDGGGQPTAYLINADGSDLHPLPGLNPGELPVEGGRVSWMPKR